MGGKVGLAAKVKNNGGYFQLDYTRKGQQRQPHKQKTPKNPIKCQSIFTLRYVSLPNAACIVQNSSSM